VGSRSYVPTIERRGNPSACWCGAQEDGALRRVWRAGRGDYRSRLGWWKHSAKVDGTIRVGLYARTTAGPCSLGYWPVARRHSAIREPRDLEGKVIATEVVHITETLPCQTTALKLAWRFSWGATEGESAAAHGGRDSGSDGDRLVSCAPIACRIVDTVLESATVFYHEPDGAGRCLEARKSWRILIS